MAVILVVHGAIAGLLAARVVKSGAPPTPDMAIEEARKIRETVSSSSDAQAGSAVLPTPAPPVVPVPSPAGTTADIHTSPTSVPSQDGPTSDNEPGRGPVDGTTLGS
jgi:hypothetical protein